MEYNLWFFLLLLGFFEKWTGNLNLQCLVAKWCFTGNRYTFYPSVIMATDVYLWLKLLISMEKYCKGVQTWEKLELPKESRGEYYAEFLKAVF